MTLPSASLCLSQFEVRSSIDFITISTPGKRDLPPLSGRPAWGVAAHYQQLTVHDLQPGDVPLLVRALPEAKILGIEVALDLRPSGRRQGGELDQSLEALFRYVARHLYPYAAPSMATAKTAGFVPGKGMRPFNFRAPNPAETLYFGFRVDGPAQVKVYVKRKDNGSELNRRLWAVRVEVTLKQSICAEFGLHGLGDLIGFRFRKLLMPYFRMVRGPVAHAKRSERAVLKLVNARLARALQEDADAAWRRNGVQAAKHLDLPQVRYRRHGAFNKRLGKALQHLEGRFGRTEMVRRELIRALPSPVLARFSSACLTGRITTREPLSLPAFLGSKEARSVTIVV